MTIRRLAAAILVLCLACHPRQSGDWAKQKDCTDRGIAYTRRVSAFMDSNSVVENSEFAYNAKLDTCICALDILRKTGRDRFVVDLIHSRTLAGVSAEFQSTPSDFAKFEKQRSEFLTGSEPSEQAAVKALAPAVWAKEEP